MAESDPYQQLFAQHGLLVMVSKHCIGPGRKPVLCAQKTKPRNVADSGWVLGSGHETSENADAPSFHLLVPLERMIATDESLKILHDQPDGTELTRLDPNAPWRWIVDDSVVDEDGKLIVDL